VSELLLSRCVLGFGETLAVLGGEHAVRRADLLGARIDVAARNPWLNAAVVPPGAAPPADAPELPGCVWTVEDSVPGRVERAELAMPCMALELAGVEGGAPVAEPSLRVLGEINERAYGHSGGPFPDLMAAFSDERARAHGLREGGEFVCVCLTLRADDDLSIQYVATEPAWRRRGLASRLLFAVMAAARDEGAVSATLTASPDGFPVYQRMGFRTVGVLRGFVRTG
jgi:GNAT superfamily N-acetyltransferase